MASSEHIEWLLEGVASWNERRAQTTFVPDFAGANIFEEFKKAEKIDSAGRVPLSGFDLRNADFRECRFHLPFTGGAANFKETRLDWAKLQDAQLDSTEFDDVWLEGARLDGASLNEASFRSARMAGAKLPGANLRKADLTGAILRGANLEGANLALATLEDADLTTTNLTSANLQWARPWQAKLFHHGDTASQPAAQADRGQPIRCIADLISACSHIKTCHPDGDLYFRGEYSNAWELRPSVMRPLQNRFPLRAREGEMLLELMSRRPEDFNDASSALAQWVRAQHHGLKTRLLDVTWNPLVALFCACERDGDPGHLHAFSVPREMIKPFNSDTVSIVANFAKLLRAEQNVLLGYTGDDIRQQEPDFLLHDSYEHALGRLYHLIRQEKPHFKERIDPRDFYRVFVVEPQMSFERIRAQSGAFLLSAFHERFERSEVLNRNPGVGIYGHSVIEIPVEKKQDILRELRLLNVTRETLFPSLDETAKAITHRHSD